MLGLGTESISATLTFCLIMSGQRIMPAWQVNLIGVASYLKQTVVDSSSYSDSMRIMSRLYA